MIENPDTLFSKPKKDIAPFSFDQSVAEVFPDMIKRSVPGYSTIIQQIEKIAQGLVTPHSNCFDLGCSLGAASLAMSKGTNQSSVKIIGVDNSKAMLTRCQQHIEAFKHVTPIELHCSDVQSFPINNASMVVLNFTLQFINKNDRDALLDKIFQGMLPGGVLLLSEKIVFDDPHFNQLMIDLHHQFKRDNGYSDLEISQKRNALENVLLPETLQQHKNRLFSIGFSTIECWFQQFNFISLIAIK